MKHFSIDIEQQSFTHLMKSSSKIKNVLFINDGHKVLKSEGF